MAYSNKWVRVCLRGLPFWLVSVEPQKDATPPFWGVRPQETKKTHPRTAKGRLPGLPRPVPPPLPWAKELMSRHSAIGLFKLFLAAQRQAPGVNHGGRFEARCEAVGNKDLTDLG